MTANYSQTRQIFLSLAGNGMINFKMLFIHTVFGGLSLLFHRLSNPQENPVTEAGSKAPSPLLLPSQHLLSFMRQNYVPKKWKEESKKKKKKPLKEGSECLACKLHLSSGDSVVLNKSEPHVSVVSLMQWPLLQHLPYMAISLRRQNPVWTHNLWGVSLTAKSGGN